MNDNNSNTNTISTDSGIEIDNLNQSPQKTNINQKIINEITGLITKNKNSKIKEEQTSEEIITYLKSNNIDITQVLDFDKSTLAHKYCSQKEYYHLQCLLLVLDKLLNTSEINNYLLHEDITNSNIFDVCSELGDLKTFRMMKKYLNKNNVILTSLTNENNKKNIFQIASDKNKAMSLLYFYSFYNNLNCLKYKNVYGWTVLHTACFRGNYQIAQYLVDLGIDINCKDKENKTPLFYAVESNNARLVKYLILNGANKNLLDSKNKKPIQYTQNKDVINILERKNIFAIMFLNATVYKSLKNHKRNILMLFILTILIIIQIIIPSKYKLINVPNNNINFNGKTETCLMIADIIFEFFALLIYVFFQIKKRKRQNLYKNMNNAEFCLKEKNIAYYEMFYYNETLCVKCRRVKSMATQHCIACDVCVDNWDHHCFFLNTCICSEDKIAFNVFLFEIFITIVLNFTTGIFYFIDLVKFPEILCGLFKCGEEKKANNFVRILLILIDFIYILMCLFFILASLIPFILDNLRKYKKIKHSIIEKNTEEVKKTPLLPVHDSQV